MPWNVGSRLGPYSVTAKIGEGRMGESRDMKLEGAARAFTRLSVRVVGVALSVTLLAGCAVGGAYTQGARAARIGDWDSAVECYRRALQEDPLRADYRIALVRAKLNASWRHIDAARAFQAHDELAAALAAYQKASEYDPSNSQTLDRLAAIEREIRDRSEPSVARPQVEAPSTLGTQPPLLDPASQEPLRIRFVDASLKDILDFIGNATGINVVYDSQFQDRPYSVQLDGVTIEEALDLILTANGYFYKVLSPRTIGVARP